MGEATTTVRNVRTKWSTPVYGLPLVLSIPGSSVCALSVLRLHIEQNEKVIRNCSELHTRRVPFSLHVLFVGVPGFCGAWAAHDFVQGLVPVVPRPAPWVFVWNLFQLVQLSNLSLDCHSLGLVPPSSCCPAQKYVSTSSNGLYVALLRPRTRVDFLFCPAPHP